MNSKDNTLTILHISDLHFGKDHYFNDDSGLSLGLWFDKFKEILTEKKIKPDIIFISGDVASIGSIDDFTSAQRFIQKELLDYFKIPLVIVPGNHDLLWARNSNEKHYKRFDNYLNFIFNLKQIKTRIGTEEYFIKPHFFTKIPNKKTLILGLNSSLFCVHRNEEDENSYSQGFFDESNADNVRFNLGKLIKCLKSIEKSSLDDYKFKIALLHHNILPEKGKGLIYPSPEDFTEILKTFGFDLILCGHLHSRKMNNLNNVILLGAGSFGANEKLKYTLNDVNIIKVKLDFSLPGFKKNPIRKMSIETFELNYESFNDAIRPLEKQTKIIEMSNKTYKILKEHFLESRIQIPDEKISIAFKKEVFDMDSDQKLFISILYISNYYDLDFFKESYNDLVEKLDLLNAREFEIVFNFFLEDKIKVTKNRAEFSNLLYYQALDTILSEKSDFKKIFEKVILFFSEDEELVNDVVWLVVENYDNLSYEVRNLLFKISNKDYLTFENPIKEIAWALLDNYDNLPKELKNLLFSLSKKKNTARGVASALAYYFEKLEEDVRNDLLLSLSKELYASPFIYRILKNNINDISADVRKKLILNLNNFKFIWNYEQPFKNMVGKTVYILGHALELLYFDNNEWVMESRSYTEDFTKNWYRWIFIGELPEKISGLIPPDALFKARTNILFIDPRTTIELPLMGGIVIKKPYQDTAGNPFYCVVDPEFVERKGKA